MNGDKVERESEKKKTENEVMRRDREGQETRLGVRKRGEIKRPRTRAARGEGHGRDRQRGGVGCEDGLGLV